MYPELSPIERIKFMREAADVQRLHTIRTIGEYSNGHHSFNMLAMLRFFWPDAPISLVWAILEHDIPERLIGDIPSPSIHNVLGDSKKAISNTEWAILDFVFDDQRFVGLEEELMKWLKALDLLELYLYTRDQLKMGNQNVSPIRFRIEKRIMENPANYPPQILNALYEIRRSDWNHLPDLGV